MTSDPIKQLIADELGIDVEDVKGNPIQGYLVDGMDWFEWNLAVNGDHD